MKIVMTFDDREWKALLKTWQAPEVRKTLEAGASAFGEVATPIIRDATPVGPVGNKYAGSPGNLRRQTRWRPFAARLGVGVVIAAMGKSAYYRRFVSGGTKPHSLARRGTPAYTLGSAPNREHHDHPGAKANDYIGKVADRAEKVGFDAADKVVLDGLDGALQRTIHPPR